MTVGAIVGLLVVVIPMLPVLNNWAQLISLGVFIGGIYYGMKRFRDGQDDYIGYGKLFITGMQIAFFASIILAFITYVTAKVIDPSLMDIYLETIEKTLQSSKMPPGIIDNNMQEMRNMISPVFLAFATIFSYTLVGIFIASICGLVLKNPGHTGKPQGQI